MQNKKVIDLIIRFSVFFIIIVFLLYILDKKIIKNNKKKPETIVKMSVFNYGSSGSMAFKELLESMDYSTIKIMDPYNTYSMKDNDIFNKTNILNDPGLLLIMEPEQNLQEKDIAQLEKFADKGFNIIIFTEQEFKIKKLINTPTENDNFDSSNNVYKDVSSDRINKIYSAAVRVSDINLINLPGKKRIQSFDNDWHEVFKDEEGILVIKKKKGDGAIIVVSDSSFLSNLNLGKNDNALFGYRLISYFSEDFNNKTIYFDEYCHGYHKKYTLLYFIAKKEYFAVIMQSVLFLIFLFYLLNIKFGQYKMPLKKEEKKIFYYSEGMAGVLSKKSYAINIFDKIINDFLLLVKLKSHHYKKDSKEKINDFIDENRSKKPNSALIKKLFTVIKECEYKK